MAQPLSSASGSSENPLVRGPPWSLEQRHQDNGDRGSSTYVLRGYGCRFLVKRPITFVQPLPSGRVCAGCSVVPAQAVQLPCGHTLCELCEDAALKRPNTRQHGDTVVPHRTGLCPVDETYFAKCERRVVVFHRRKLLRYRAFCVNRRFGCAFEAELCELREHCFKDGCIPRRTCLVCRRGNILACDMRWHRKLCLPFQGRTSKQKPSQESPSRSTNAMTPLP